ncbi:hypothetical protein AVEN_141980-1 [Araneus ventricosus]|uniref:Uncharacterized protein n=1 Tax=Araneus ventricosus TaxID=182803 RepID=A0A4Y2N6P6_ARAVE|nr:hypothetical protein AVEN_141980-1 [Araneus ventricosus]
MHRFYFLQRISGSVLKICPQYNGQALKSNAVTLQEFSLDKGTGALAKILVLSLEKKVKSFKFVASLAIWHSGLFKVYVINNIDVSSAVEMIDRTRQAMVEMRSDKRFQQADARDLSNSFEIEAEFQERDLWKKRSNRILKTKYKEDSPKEI